MRGFLVNIIIILILPICAIGQQVVIQPPIFSSFECTEFYKLFTGSIMNFSTETYNATLFLEVDYTSPNGSTSRLADGVITGNPSIEIAPGNVPVNSANLESVYPQRNITFYNRDIQDLLNRTKCLPPGTYNVCLTLYDVNTSTFGEEYIAQTCYERDKEMLNQLFLVSPFEYEELLLDLPLFTWTAILPYNPDANYRIQIVEMLANQTPFEAFRSNPIFYEEKGIKSNIFQYPIPARTMLPCTNYAWRVSYELDGRFVNAGFLEAPNFFQESEIWTFSKPCDEGEEEEEEEFFEEFEPKYFYKLTTNKAQGFQKLNKKELFIEIDNPYNELTQITYSITDEKGNRFVFPPPDFEDAFKTEKSINNSYLKSGKNYLTVDLDEIGLSRGSFYTLEINGLKEIQILKFKYEEDEK